MTAPIAHAIRAGWVDRLADSSLARRARERAQLRVLLVCIAISLMMHAWLLAGVDLDESAGRRDAFHSLFTLRFVFEPTLSAVPSGTAPTAPATRPPSPVAPAPDAPKANAFTADRTHADASRSTDRNLAAASAATHRDEPIELPDWVRPARGGADALPAATSAALDQPAIATADQYRLALILAARREREQTGTLGQFEGRARVRLEFGSGGTLQSAQVIASSGHDLLDAEALRLFGRAYHRLPVPDALLARPFAVDATVSFERE